MVNLQLQGDSLNLIKTKSILTAFLARVKLMKQNIGRGEFSQFPNLSQTSCQEDDVSTYVQHLNALYSDFVSRFEDILTMVIPPWIINPYGDIEETNVIIQEELTELSTNEELKVQFKNGHQQFWLQNNIPVTYPVLWNIARKFLISFPSSYLVESGFSAVTNLLTRKRIRLDIISRGDLRLTLTKLTSNVDDLLLKHQARPYFQTIGRHPPDFYERRQQPYKNGIPNLSAKNVHKIPPELGGPNRMKRGSYISRTCEKNHHCQSIKYDTKGTVA
ncbi:unnamed protein product [Acanthoscelides obtectus]|uniref:SCAN domain-containing protein 3 n=1 Tax=Acanthoscelides obtectus TaxID=200917 RepID=A0A9P0KWY3_ACAOB|nr:unnamed protein product [Acanthoscelides obtectus]CAK1660470.1 SCAN domain-containing protein 3 [Acanthoscelides obtectus]